MTTFDPLTFSIICYKLLDVIELNVLETRKREILHILLRSIRFHGLEFYSEKSELTFLANYPTVNIKMRWVKCRINR